MGISKGEHTLTELAIIPQDIIPFNPTLPLAQRTEAWIIALYLQAQGQVEEEYQDAGIEFAPWKILTENERKVDAVECLPVDKRQLNIQYQEAIDQKALDIADGLTEALRTAIAEIITIRERKRLKWAKVNGYEDIKAVARKNIPIPDNSTGRQINAFIERHMDTIKAAGVPKDQTLALIALPDKYIINTARVISRTGKDDTLTEDEKYDKIRDVVTFAVKTDSAANITRRFITSPIQIPRDVVHLADGTTLVTFIVTTEDEFIVLDAKTTGISVQYGNAQPILAETQARRLRHELMQNLQTILAILESGPHTFAQIDEYTAEPKELLDTLYAFDLIELADEKYTLKEMS